ncbi:MAG TPA: hypothetical protein VIY69_17460 [Candidatus Acidoferrales bacterium]
MKGGHRLVASLFVALIGNFGIPLASQAASYNLNTQCLFGFCGAGQSYGTVDISGGGSSLTYVFDLSAGQLKQSNGGILSLSTVAVDFTGTETSFTVSGNSYPWTQDSNGGNGVLGFFTDGFDCSGTGSTCDGYVEIVISGLNLAPTFTPSLNSDELFAGADISCADGSCTTDPEVYATLAATPLPATLPLFAGGLGFVGYLTARKRRKGQQAIA